MKARVKKGAKGWIAFLPDGRYGVFHGWREAMDYALRYWRRWSIQ